GYSHGGVAGALYKYTGDDLTDATRMDLGIQDYRKGPWTRVQTDLSKENFNDTSRWVKETSIEAVAVAGSVALGIGASGAGIALSGAGAEATNVILTKVDASVENSKIKAGAGGGGPDPITGNVLLDAQGTSTIQATIVAASVAVGAGEDAGVGVSIGA